MLLYRLAPDGDYAVRGADGGLRRLEGDPLASPPAAWTLGEPIGEAGVSPLAPVRPGKIVGIGRSYRGHAEELGHPMPDEPLLFLKAPSAVIGPGEAIRLPPESREVHFEGEIALVLGRRLRRASAAEARAALLGVTAACDVTARDLQRGDRTFARAKSFDTFCPLGPAIRLDPELEDLGVVTRVNGVERQRGRASELAWSVLEMLAYVSRMMTLEPGDVVLTGTPAGVGPLAAGDRIEVEVDGVGVLENPVEGHA